MLKHWKPVVIGTIAFLAWAAWLATSSPAYKECQAEENKYRTYHPTERFDLSDDAMALLRCEITAVDENEGFIVGFFTMLLVVSTILLWAATVRLARDAEEATLSTKQSVELAWREFTASHRPRIRIRRISLKDRDLEASKAKIIVANVGEGDALIHEGVISFALKEGHKWRDANILDFGQPNLPAKRDPLGPGGHHAIILKPKSGSVVPAHQIEAVKRGTYKLFAMGEIPYSDKNGLTRRTGFCWQYDLDRGDFVKPNEKDDPEWNYED